MSTTTHTRPAFDKQEREAIQRALRRYMDEHRIGTPTLQLRIMEADEPHRRELPLSTLQRFITGSHRTSDAYVGMCRRFLESVGERFDAPRFGSALAAFLGDLPSGEEGADLESYAGAYIIHPAEDFPAGNEGRTFAAFTPVPEQNFLAVTETGHAPWGAGATALRREVFEGAFVANPPRGFVVLRSCLTRQPKTYLLRPPSEGSSAMAMFEGVASHIDLVGTIRQQPVRIDMRSRLIGEDEKVEGPE